MQAESNAWKGKIMHKKIVKSNLIKCLLSILPEEHVEIMIEEIINFLLKLNDGFDFKNAEEELFTDLVEYLNYDNIEIDGSSARFFIYTVLKAYAGL